MRYAAAALAALLATAGAAEARQHYPARGHRIVPAAQAPLDGFTVPTGAYAFRKLKSTYGGAAIRIRRASDNAQLNINFLGFVPGTGAPWDVAAAISHCASTTCYGVTWFDQSGGVADITQATAANQPELVFDCLAPNIPCLRFTLATQILGGPSVTPATGVVTLSVIGKKSVVGGCIFLRQQVSNRVAGAGAAGNWTLASTGSIVRAAPDAAWHSAVGVINGASSVLSIDGTEGGGTVTGSVAAGGHAVVGAASVTCDAAEAVVWDNYAMPPAERAAWGTNQRSWGGF